MVYKEIVQKIIDLFNADAALKDAEQDGGPGSEGITKWYFGRPTDIAGRRTPYGYVQYDGRRGTDRFNVDQTLYELDFEVGVIDSNPSEDDAEKSVYDKIEAVEAVLLADPTLGGLVNDAGKVPYDITVLDVPSERWAMRLGALMYAVRKWMS